MHRYDSIPELAGLATYADAARVGWTVEANVRRLLRLQWSERRLMATMIARLTSEPVWEVKCALALHQWQCAEHVDALRTRIAEMRSPVPTLDAAPDDCADVEHYFDDLLTRSSREVTTGIYEVVFPALANAYRAHLAGCNPLVDHPTARIVRSILADVEAAAEWGQRATAALRGADPQRDEIPAERFHPRRDERFHGQYNFDFAPHVVYNMPGVSAEERNLALVCKRTLEMDVPEMMASFMTERTGEPWEFYRDYSRQLWDEARHAMMGSVALEARGIDWKREIPLNVSFALRLNLHAEPIERQMLLLAIEQSLMPGDSGKRFEYETAVAAGDALSAHFHDYDWADEVLHTQIGRRALKRDDITVDDARRRAMDIHERTWNALKRYEALDEQRDWWPDFVRRTLGRESESAKVDRPALNVLNE